MLSADAKSSRIDALSGADESTWESAARGDGDGGRSTLLTKCANGNGASDSAPEWARWVDDALLPESACSPSSASAETSP